MDNTMSGPKNWDFITVTAMAQKPREGVIIEWPLNGQFHHRRDVILTSRMADSNIFLTVTII